MKNKHFGVDVLIIGLLIAIASILGGFELISFGMGKPFGYFTSTIISRISVQNIAFIAGIPIAMFGAVLLIVACDELAHR